MNRDLIENFRLLQEYYKQKKDRGRVIAYGKAIKSLQFLDFKITDVNQLEGIRGIGPKIKAKVREYLDTGQIGTVEEKKEELKTEEKKEST